MGRDWRIVDAGGSVLGWWSLSTLVFVGLVVLIVGLLIVALLSRRDEPVRSEIEREVRGNMEGQIRSMLLQAGGELTQDRIRENLGIPVVDASRELAELEKRGEIRREWLPLEYTFRVYLPKATQGSPAPASGSPVQPSS